MYPDADSRSVAGHRSTAAVVMTVMMLSSSGIDDRCFYGVGGGRCPHRLWWLVAVVTESAIVYYSLRVVFLSSRPGSRDAPSNWYSAVNRGGSRTVGAGAKAHKSLIVRLSCRDVAVSLCQSSPTCSRFCADHLPNNRQRMILLSQHTSTHPISFFH